MLGLPSISVVILAKLNVNWQGLQFIYKKIFYSKQILWNLKLHSKTHPIKSTTPFKASYISKTKHCMLKFFSPLFADNILPISMYKNIPILNTVLLYTTLWDYTSYYKYWYWESNKYWHILFLNSFELQVKHTAGNTCTGKLYIAVNCMLLHVFLVSFLKVLRDKGMLFIK